MCSNCQEAHHNPKTRKCRTCHQPRDPQPAPAPQSRGQSGVSWPAPPVQPTVTQLPPYLPPTPKVTQLENYNSFLQNLKKVGVRLEGLNAMTDVATPSTSLVAQATAEVKSLQESHDSLFQIYGADDALVKSVKRSSIWPSARLGKWPTIAASKTLPPPNTH